MSTIPQILNKAADLIEPYGYYQYGLSTYEHKLDIYTGILAVGALESLYEPTLLAVIEHLNLERPEGRRLRGPLLDWNYSGGKTAKDVVAALRGAALGPLDDAG